MICAGGTTAPIQEGANTIDLLYDHFEPVREAGQRPAFVLHVSGRQADSQSAVFALLPVTPGYAPQRFVARWGRQGVGPFSFMPIPAQVEDASRASIAVYGHAAYNFNWRHCQWEVTASGESVSIAEFEIPSLKGETIELPGNSQSAYAFSGGLPVANVDLLAEGDHPEWRLSKEIEADSRSYKVVFGGRVWRRWLGGGERQGSGGGAGLELLAFDLQSSVVHEALDSVWGEIGGQDEAKRELIRAIQWPVLYPELFLLFKRRRSRGVLLYGPPGCGKTLLGKSVVKLMAALYNRKADDGGFKYVKGHQLLDQFVGNSEKAVKVLFDEARRWKEQRGYPAVLFFDEADALFKRRPGGSQEGFFTLVPALLAEMDGMEDSGAFVMLATNRPDSLDPAITRAGRIDRRIRVTRPDVGAAARIFAIHLEGVFLDAGRTVDGLAAEGARLLFDDAHVLYEVQWQGGVEVAIFRLRDLASGSLIHNIVDRATANKMEFCIENGVRTGLNGEDLRQAVSEVLAEQREVKHHEELLEFGEVRGQIVELARKLA